MNRRVLSPMVIYRKAKGDVLWADKHTDAEAALIEREDADAAAKMVLSKSKAYQSGVATSAVYFIEAVGSGFVKIGYVADFHSIADRIRQMQTGCPYELRLAAVLPSGGRDHETQLHLRFEAERFRGEWFAIGGRVQSLIHHLNDKSASGARDLLRSLDIDIIDNLHSP